jgi:hypothetical protein
VARAESLRLLHMQEFPNYKYRPRKRNRHHNSGLGALSGGDVSPNANELSPVSTVRFSQGVALSTDDAARLRTKLTIDSRLRASLRVHRPGFTCVSSVDPAMISSCAQRHSAKVPSSPGSTELPGSPDSQSLYEELQLQHLHTDHLVQHVHHQPQQHALKTEVKTEPAGATDLTELTSYSELFSLRAEDLASLELQQMELPSTSELLTLTNAYDASPQSGGDDEDEAAFTFTPTEVSDLLSEFQSKVDPWLSSSFSGSLDDEYDNRQHY